jgi:hypothetical protein
MRDGRFARVEERASLDVAAYAASYRALVS